jgi:hypothetical protein
VGKILHHFAPLSRESLLKQQFLFDQNCQKIVLTGDILDLKSIFENTIAPFI